MASSACEDAFRHVPWRDVDDVGAEHRREGSWQAQLRKLPVRCAGIEAHRRSDVVASLMPAPGIDAAQVSVETIARPPRDRWRLPGELDHVLPRAAADLQHVAAATQQKA